MLDFAILHAAHPGSVLLLLSYEVLAELYPVLGWHAQQIGNDEHSEGLGEVGHDLALATGNEGVDLLVGQLPHELLVFLEALRRDQSHQQGPMVGVLRRIHGRELIAEWRLVAVGFDQLGNVFVLVSLQGNGAARKRSRGRHAGGKTIGIVVDLEGFVVARHHEDALMRLTQYRRLLSQVVKVGVRIVHEPVAAEEIVLFKLVVFQRSYWLLVRSSAGGGSVYHQWPGLPGIAPEARDGRRRHAHCPQPVESPAGTAGSISNQVAHSKHPGAIQTISGAVGNLR